jgi:Cornifin (SPRR) family
VCFEGDFQWIKYNQDNTVTVSFTPQREGLCEAILELTFCDHKQKADFVIKRTLSGRAKQPAGGQTKQPSDGRTKQPSGGQTKQPADGQIKQPTGGQIKQPAGGKTKQPAGGQTKQPAGGQTKQPSGGRTRQPADGQTIQPAGGQAAGGKSEGHLQIEYWPNAGPQPADDQLDYYARIPADEELLDNDGTGISVSHPDGLDFGIVERMRRNGPFATPSSLLTIKHEDDLPAVAFVLGRTKTLDGYDREWVIAFP